MTNTESTIAGIKAASKQSRDGADFSGAAQLGAQLKGVVEQIKALVGDSRQIAGLAMVHASRMESAKLRSLDRDHAVLALKLGDKHPRVVALADRIEQHRALDVNLQSLDARVASRPPAVAEESSIIYGRVVSNDGQPVSGVTVAAHGEAARAMATDVTDSKGRYELRVKVPKSTISKSKSEKAEQAAEKSSSELRLEVTGVGERRLHRGPMSIPLDAGGATYREIVLDETDGNAGQGRKTSTAKSSRARAAGRPRNR